VQSLQLNIPCDGEIIRGDESPLRQPCLTKKSKSASHRRSTDGRLDGTADGNPQRAHDSALEAIRQSSGINLEGKRCVSQKAREPNQLVREHTRKGLEKLQESDRRASPNNRFGRRATHRMQLTLQEDSAVPTTQQAGTGTSFIITDPGPKMGLPRDYPF